MSSSLSACGLRSPRPPDAPDPAGAGRAYMDDLTGLAATPPITSRCWTPRSSRSPTRPGHPVLVRAGGAGCIKVFLAHVRSLRDTGVACGFSVRVGHRWERSAIAALLEIAWTSATDADGAPRPVDEAAVAELTAPVRALTGYPTGTRVIVRR